MRCFWAVEISRTLWPQVEQLQQMLRRAGAAASWARPEQLHLTLHFLGEQPEAVLGALERIGRRATSQVGPFWLYSDAPGAFPDPNRPRVVWLGFREDENLIRLHRALGQELRAWGFRPEERPFRPHLTVARLKRPMPLRDLLERFPWEPVPQAVRELVLYKSELRPEGARYRALLALPLVGA
ncbi:MAG: RNA 2',3'-cyclic phosphodiesterase [Bacteroidetes bacterium]|nr:RNA 2',3'-cyclic phosphodiesterase [Bacteroidota bacterium]